MIILRPNFLNTTTMVSTTNGTVTAANLFDQQPARKWTTDNADTDATTATLEIHFGETLTVSQIILKNINVKDFTIHYNAVTSTSLWSTFTTNSATNLYIEPGTTTGVESVHLTLNSTISANSQKTIGDLYISNLLYDFTDDRLPNAKSYKPFIFKKQIKHTMSDGGTILYNIRDKYHASIKMGFVPTSTVDTLRTIYDLDTAFLFVPFQTTSGWDGDIAEVVWPGNFDFMQFSDNNLGNGFQGRVQLMQTPGGIF